MLLGIRLGCGIASMSDMGMFRQLSVGLHPQSDSPLLGLLKEGMNSTVSDESPDLYPVFLCERWNDTVQAQVRD